MANRNAWAAEGEDGFGRFAGGETECLARSLLLLDAASYD